MVCLICFEVIEKPIFVGPDAAAKILKNCKTHLHSTITKETLKDVQLKNEMPLCKSCFDSSWELTQLNVQLETVQKEISDASVTFNLAVFQRRSQVYNSHTQSNVGSVNKSSIIELNVSCLPANTFLTKEVHQNEQQLNEKINHNIITDYLPDDNIEIINLKFESCDLQFEDVTEYCQQITGSVDAEISFSNEIQDYNQPCLENAKTSLTLQREVPTAEDVETADSTNLKGDMQGVISEKVKPVKIPQVEPKRMKIVDLKLNAPSTRSCQQKSQPGPQLLNRYKDNGLSNSNCASSNSMGVKPLKWHHRSHTVEKLYKCSFCTKRFSQNSDRKCHEVVHTEEKPYKRSFCTKEFALAKSRRVHQRIHTAQKPYECSICKKRFTQNGSLKSHERTHTGEKRYECSFCQKRFITYYDKKCHERIHTGEKSYKCSICSKGFSFMGNLTRHEKSHSGEKPYECSFCKKRFTQMQNLKVHERKSHSGVKTF